MRPVKPPRPVTLHWPPPLERGNSSGRSCREAGKGQVWLSLNMYATLDATCMSDGHNGHSFFFCARGTLFYRPRTMKDQTTDEPPHKMLPDTTHTLNCLIYCSFSVFPRHGSRHCTHSRSLPGGVELSGLSSLPESHLKKPEKTPQIAWPGSSMWALAQPWPAEPLAKLAKLAKLVEVAPPLPLTFPAGNFGDPLSLFPRPVLPVSSFFFLLIFRPSFLPRRGTLPLISPVRSSHFSRTRGPSVETH
jgi:hypothetical protein